MQLTKHHGLGNDFLVLLAGEVDAARVRALCDRHRGVGADGVLVGARDPFRMTLWNADGSPAEMSGNGIRCLVQAMVMAGWLTDPEVTIETGAGPKVVSWRPTEQPGLILASVAMGQAAAGPRGHIDMGNPHEVLAVDDVETVEPPGGALDHNVEFVARGPEPDAITMRVWERGVGETLACGTGACAAAYAAHDWGWVGTTVTVHQRGGDALVDLRPDTIVLTGPSEYVATIEVHQ